MKSDCSLSLWLLSECSLSILWLLWMLSECLLNAPAESSWSHPQVIWGCPEDVLKTSWSHPEVILKSSWSHPEVILKSSSSHPQVIWGCHEEILKTSWSHHEESEAERWRLNALDNLVPDRQTGRQTKWHPELLSEPKISWLPQFGQDPSFFNILCASSLIFMLAVRQQVSQVQQAAAYNITAVCQIITTHTTRRSNDKINGVLCSTLNS